MDNTTPQAGEHIRQYLLKRKLADDIHGALWEGEHDTTGNPARIRVLESVRLRIGTTQKLAGLVHLRHPNLASVTEVNLNMAWANFVYEESPGTPLSSIVDQGPVPWANAAEIVAQILDALAAAHGLGFTYGRIHADAVILTEEAVVLTDIGLQEAIEPHFLDLGEDGTGIPPSEGPSIRGDIASAGTFLWAIVTGRAPSADLTPASSIVEGVPRALDEFIQRCRSSEPSRQFGGAKEAMGALIDVMDRELGPSSEEALDSQDTQGVAPVVAPVEEEPEPPKPEAKAPRHQRELDRAALPTDPIERVKALERHLASVRTDAEVEDEIKSLKQNVGRAELQKAKDTRGKALLKQTGAVNVMNWIICAVGAIAIFGALWWIIDKCLQNTFMSAGTRHALSLGVPAALIFAGLWLAAVLGLTRNQEHCYAVISDHEVLCHHQQRLDLLLQVPAAQIMDLTIERPTEPLQEHRITVRITTWAGELITLQFGDS